MSAAQRPTAFDTVRLSASPTRRVAAAVLLVLLLLLPVGALASPVPSGSAHAPVAPPRAAVHAVAPLTTAPAPSGGPAMQAPARPYDEFRQVQVQHLAPSSHAANPAVFASLVGTEFLANGTIGKGLLSSKNLAYPTAVAYDSVAGTVFVAGGYTSTVGQYDPSNGTVVTFTQLPITWILDPNIPTVQITALYFDAPLDRVMVAAPLAGGVYSIDAATGAVVSFYYMGPRAYPDAITGSLDGNSLFVADAENSSVADIATAGGFTFNATVGQEPDALALDSASNTLYVANYQSNNVSIVTTVTGRTTGSIDVGMGPQALAVAPTTGTLWVLNAGSGNVSLYTGSSLSSLALPATSAGNATSLVVDTGMNTVFVLNAPSGHLAAFNATTGAAGTAVTTSGLPYAAVYDAADGWLAIANISSDELTIVNDATDAVAQVYRLGAAPTATVFSATSQEVYVADPSVYWLTELDARTDAIIGTVPLASPGFSLAFASTAGLIAVIETHGAVAFFSTGSGTVAGSWTPGNETTFAAGTYGNGEFAFTASPAGASLSELFDEVFIVSASGFVEISDVVAGHFDDGIIYDSSNRFVDVATNTTILEVSTVSDALYGTLATNNTGQLSWTGLAWDNVSNELYIGGFPNGGLDILNLTNASRSFTFSLNLTVHPPGFNPAAVVYLRQTNTVYVTDSYTGNTYAIAKSGLFAYSELSEPAALGAAGLGYSTLSGILYVAGPQDGTISLLTIGPDNTEGMVVTLSATPRTVQLGSPVLLQAIATYPEWSDNFSYTGLPGSCPNANVTRMACTAGAANSFTVTVKAKNPFGFSATASASFVVFSPLALTSFTATPSAITLGGSFRVLLSDFGGVQPLTVGYPLRPTGCAATTSVNWTCTPTASGNFTLEATVSDSAGHSVDSNLTVVVNPHLGAVLSVSPNSTQSGHAVTFTTTVSGGTAPFQFVYTGLPAGCTAANSSTITCSPTTGGAYPVVVQVKDSDGAAASSSAALTVSSPGTGNTSPNGGLSTTDLLLIVVVIVVIAAAAIILATRRRGGPAPGAVRRPPPASSPPEEVEPAPMEEPAPVEEAPPAEPIMPPPAAPAPRPVTPVAAGPPPNNPNAPSAGAIEEEPERQYYQGSNVVSDPRARGQRPGLVCPKCGTVNEPWLTNCRKCKRALTTTGGT